MSRAAFIREAVEFYMRETAPSRPPRTDTKLQDDNRKLRDELKLRSLALEKAETDLFRLQNAAFLESHGRGNLGDLRGLLEAGGLWPADRILGAMGISPRDKAIFSGPAAARSHPFCPIPKFSGP